MAEADRNYWIALCWDRVPAGPTPGGPPWLFLTQEHAERYAGQLRARGIPAQARGWLATVVEWRGESLVKYPLIPPPELEASAPTYAPPALSSGTPEASHDVTQNGTSAPGAAVPPPPTPSLE